MNGKGAGQASALLEAGFTEQEIIGWIGEKEMELRAAGHSDEEIAAYFGQVKAATEEKDNA